MLAGRVKIVARHSFTSCNTLPKEARFFGSCCVKPYFDETVHGDTAFSVRSVNIKFGKNILPETGEEVLNLFSRHGGKRVGVFTDKNVSQLPFFYEVTNSLKKVGVDYVIYDQVRIEPTDVSFMHAAEFVKETNIDLAISIGGGSVMDSAKAAILYGKHPPPNNDFLYYVNAPVGLGNAVKEKVIPHIAIPTTSGTGSECTGFAICSIKHHPTAPNSKTGIASAALVPTMAIIDPTVTHSLPVNVISASGFDVLSHALESYTARPFTKRPKANPPHLRPLNQGANPYADFGCLEAIRICANYFERAMTDENDLEAREQMMWAATLAGTVMGNVGVHLPHGLSYPLSGNVKTYYPPKGYANTHPLIPHGMGVILSAPAAFRFTAPACPDRHLKCCEVLGLDISGVDEKDSGEVLSNELIRLIKVAKFPNGIKEVGFSAGDIEMLSKACYQQKRVIDNAPLPVSELDIQHMYKGNLSHW